MNYTLFELEEVLEGSFLGTKRSFSFVSTDSRAIPSPESTVFIARKGPHFDSHRFIQEVYEYGVRSFIVERSVDLPSDAAILEVEDGLKALQRLASFHRRRFDIPVIGITGSNGKTIVKEWSDTLLSRQYKTVKSPGSYNSQLGVPLSVLLLNDSYELALFEAGISQTREMENLEEVILPTMGVFTNIGAAHDAGFRTREEKIIEKSKLFKHCEKIICCKDHDMVYSHLKSKYGEKVLSWSVLQEAAISFQLDGHNCEVKYEGNSFQLTLPFSGKPHEENLLHVISLCVALDLDSQLIQDGLNSLENVDMRLSFKEGRDQCYLLDDTYNNDINGLEVALGTLSQQKQRSRRTVILSDFLQIENHEDTFTETNKLLLTNDIDRLIGIGPNIQKSEALFQLPAKFYNSTEDFLSDPPGFNNEMILIKGAREFHFEKIVKLLSKKSHRTELTINFTHLQHNLNAYRKLLSPATKMMVMVKAFAYGGGSYEIANFLQYHQVDYLAVAYFDEAVNLRENGIDLPIMVMNPSLKDLEDFEKYNLEPEIFSQPVLHHFLGLGIRVPIHLKIDTGMKRLGFDEEQIPKLIKSLREHTNVSVASIFTHLAGSEEEQHDDFTLLQAQVFSKVYRQLADALGYEPLKHIVNSAGIARWPGLHFTMVRLGIGLLGVDTTKKLNLKAAGNLRTEISQVRFVNKGESVGYGRTGIAHRDSKIAVLPIGYADGYLRVFGNGIGKVLIHNRLVPTIGNICMDMTMVDVTGLEVMEGDEAIILGDEPSLEDLAKWSHTIPYEIMTNLGPRVSRTYAWN